ncbi:hypothetical protein Droror1_Dr00027532 [Drosera rotundifolia]
MRLRHRESGLTSQLPLVGSDGIYCLSDHAPHSLRELFEETSPRGTSLVPLSSVAPFRAVVIMELPLDLPCGC